MESDISGYFTIVYVFGVKVILCRDCGFSRFNLSYCYHVRCDNYAATYADK